MTNQPTAKIARTTSTSGRGGFPSVTYVYEVRVSGAPLMRKDGAPRTWRSATAATAAAKREGLTVRR